MVSLFYLPRYIIIAICLSVPLASPYALQQQEVTTAPIIPPSPVQEVLKSTITAAPELIKRDSEYSYCSGWSISGGGLFSCSYGETCLFSTVSGTFIEFCGNPVQTSFDPPTTCVDWYFLTSSPPAATLVCPVTLPYCGTYYFVSTVGDTSQLFTDFTCLPSLSFFRNVFPVAATVAATTSVSNSVSTVSDGISIVSTIASTERQPTSSTNSASNPTSEAAPPASTSSASSPSSPSSGVNTAAAIGGAVGGFAGLLLAILGVMKFFKRKDKSIIQVVFPDIHGRHYEMSNTRPTTSR